MTETYTPNFDDPRVLKKMRTAYGFARGCLSETKPRAWAKNALDKNFGSQNHPLSKWLRDQLLVCTDNRYSMDTGKTKEYVVNKAGVDFVRSILLGEQTKASSSTPTAQYLSVAQVPGLVDPTDLFDYHVVKNWAVREYGDQLESGVFEYEDKADRLWNPLQNVRSKFRAPLLAEHGFEFDYDIQACAPTLILQHAQHLGMDLWLPSLTEYLKDRKAARQRVAQVANITEQDAKVLINALFCGAKLGANRDFALFHLLKQDHRKVRALQADEWLTELRANIKTCWEYIEPTMTRVEVITVKGKTRKVPLNSKRKWARYFQLERQVMVVVRDEMKAAGVDVFLEHDGWRTKTPVNTAELEQVILNKTGFAVKIEGGE